MKSTYTAPGTESESKALDNFEASELSVKYPSAVMTWRNSWERFTLFLELPLELRKVIYPTNAIESMNYCARSPSPGAISLPTRRR